jgi:hypothetical protein
MSFVTAEEMVDHAADSNKGNSEKCLNKRWITAKRMHSYPTVYPQWVVDYVEFIFQIISLYRRLWKMRVFPAGPYLSVIGPQAARIEA